MKFHSFRVKSLRERVNFSLFYIKRVWLIRRVHYPPLHHPWLQVWTFFSQLMTLFFLTFIKFTSYKGKGTLEYQNKHNKFASFILTSLKFKMAAQIALYTENHSIPTLHQTTIIMVVKVAQNYRHQSSFNEVSVQFPVCLAKLYFGSDLLFVHKSDTDFIYRITMKIKSCVQKGLYRKMSLFVPVFCSYFAVTN